MIDFSTLKALLSPCDTLQITKAESGTTLTAVFPVDLLIPAKRLLIWWTGP